MRAQSCVFCFLLLPRANINRVDANRTRAEKGKRLNATLRVLISSSRIRFCVRLSVLCFWQFACVPSRVRLRLSLRAPIRFVYVSFATPTAAALLR